MTEHALKFQLDRFTLTPVRVRKKSYSKTDGHTNTHTHTDGLFKITFLDGLLIVHPKPGLIENSISLYYDANTSMGHGSTTDKSCRCSPSEQTAGIVWAKETKVLYGAGKRAPPPQPSPLVCSGALFVWVTFGPNFLQNNGFG